MVMFKFKTVATDHLKLLWIIFQMATAFRLLPANLATNCGAEVYQHLILALDFQLLTSLAAAVLLLVVRTAVSAAESNAVTAATRAGAKAFIARHKTTATAVDGIGCITAKWRRVLLRGMLLLAVVLSAASCLLAVVAMEDWFAYSFGCDNGYGVGSPLSVFLMVSTVLFHGFSAWAALSQN